jgi:hypothetical protein
MSIRSTSRRTLIKASSLSAGAFALGAVTAETAAALGPAPEGQVYANSLNFRLPKHIIPLSKSSPQKVAAGVPDSQLTRETTGLLREYSTPTLINHSHLALGQRIWPANRPAVRRGAAVYLHGVPRSGPAEDLP